MQKTKIIASYRLECLKDEMLRKIDEAERQALAYRQQYNQQQKTRQKKEILSENSSQEQYWRDRSKTLHECLCDIMSFESEIEI